MSEHSNRASRVFGNLGSAAILAWRSIKTLFSTKLEFRATVYQFEQMGVKSMLIAAATAIFVGIVMTIQFAIFADKYGAKDALGKVIQISEARELAPSLTSLVVGCRIAAGMAAEIGSMKVTEQIDAIRALGANPIQKLVVPRIVAGVLLMPLIAGIAYVLGMLAAAFIASSSHGIPFGSFMSTALDAATLKDFFSGLAKTPFFGFIIAIVGCHRGMNTAGGTEGVGRSTTEAVEVVAISILIADAVLTQLFWMI